MNATANHHLLRDLVRFPDQEVWRTEWLKVLGNKFLLTDETAVAIWHGIEEGMEFTIPEIADVSNEHSPPLGVGLWHPERVAVSNRKELVGVDVPGFDRHG